MLSGRVAMSIYTLPRATRDFDFIVHLQPKDIDLLASHFNQGYYCDKDAINDAVRHRSIFTIIDFESGFKADFVILKNSEYRQTEFSRRMKMDFSGMSLYVVTPEDLLLSKLIWIQEVQSPIQMEDIKQLGLLQSLDWDYIRQWIKKLNIVTFDLI